MLQDLDGQLKIKTVSPYSVPSRHVLLPLSAEYLALREAIMKHMDLGLAKIRCESYYALLIKAINSGSSLSGLNVSLADICSLDSSFEFMLQVDLPCGKHSCKWLSKTYLGC